MAEVATDPRPDSDLEAVPENLVAEIIDGALETHPRPRPRPARAANRLESPSSPTASRKGKVVRADGFLSSSRNCTSGDTWSYLTLLDGERSAWPQNLNTPSSISHLIGCARSSRQLQGGSIAGRNGEFMQRPAFPTSGFWSRLKERLNHSRFPAGSGSCRRPSNAASRSASPPLKLFPSRSMTFFPSTCLPRRPRPRPDTCPSTSSCPRSRPRWRRATLPNG